MGAYINPIDMTKEEWLRKAGTRIDAPAYGKEQLLFDAYKREGKLIICLVENSFFTAAAIGYSYQEVREFNDYRDTRPKKWYVVPEDILHEVSPELKNYQH